MVAAPTLLAVPKPAGSSGDVPGQVEGQDD